MNKICTDIKQSRKLIELGIDINTADMHYMYRHWEIDEETIGSQSDASIGFDSDFYYGADNGKTYHYIPAWSLSTLLGLMPRIEHLKPFIDLGAKLDSEGVSIYYHSEDSPYIVREDLLDAAFDMVCWLKENKKI